MEVAAKSANADPRLAQIEDQPSLPRVLLIADSVFEGDTLPVPELLKGKANLHRIPPKGHATLHGLANNEAIIPEERRFIHPLTTL